MPCSNLNWRNVTVAQQGTVKWFNSQKGFGFIQPDGGGNDVFVHISVVEQAGLSGLNENQKVSFDTETGRNGKVAAVNLKVV
jgi:CspA family cold shock protein